MTILRLALPRQVFYGWWVVAACAAISAIGGVSYQWGFTVFFLPLSADLGLSRAAASLVFSVARLEGGLEGPAVGWLVDRFGPRRLQLFGAGLAGLGFILLSQVHSFLSFFLVYTMFIGIGQSAGFAHPNMAAANSWFIRRKATAMSIISAGFGMGGFLVPLLSLVVLGLGWRPAAVIVGLTLWLVVFILSRVVRRSPEAMGLLPDGDTAPATAPGDTNSDYAGNDEGRPGYVDFTLRQAMKNRTLWVLAASMSLFFAVSVATIIHFVPMAVDRGMSPQAAAMAILVLAIVTVPMRLAGGLLADRFSKKAILILAGLNGMLGLTLLLLATQAWHFYLFVVVWGLTYGVGHIHWSLIGEYFGRKNFATIRGFLDLLRVTTVMAAPVYAGRVYDVYQNYDLAIYTFIAAYLGAVLFYLIARPPKLPEAA